MFTVIRSTYEHTSSVPYMLRTSGNLTAIPGTVTFTGYIIVQSIQSTVSSSHQHSSNPYMYTYTHNYNAYIIMT